MKTSLKTALALGMTAMIMSASVLTSDAAVKCREAKLLSANQDIKKLIVTGNTIVYLVQRNKESVDLDENYRDRVSFKQTGNTLSINSAANGPVTVTVYVKDLYRIDVSGNSVVKTSGTMKVKYLQVILKDKAFARIKANTESIYTVTADNSNLKLIGTTKKHIIKSDDNANLNTQRLAALNTEPTPSGGAVAINMNRRSAAGKGDW